MSDAGGRAGALRTDLEFDGPEVGRDVVERVVCAAVRGAGCLFLFFDAEGCFCPCEVVGLEVFEEGEDLVV